MDVFAAINARYKSLSPSERRVAAFVQQHPEEVATLSLQALAMRCGTSDATVLRFSRSIGFSGYHDFKSALIPALLERGSRVRQELAGDDPVGTFVQTLARDALQTLRAVDLELLDHVAGAIVGADRRLLIGLAGSAGVARIFGASLLSIGLPAAWLSDRVEIERFCDLTGTGDVVIGISHSGDTPEVCHALVRCQERGATTVAMTNFSPSPVEEGADHVILTSVPESLMGSYSCYPRIMELLVLEVLLSKVTDQLRAGDDSSRPVGNPGRRPAALP